jgi:uncharacterized protein YjbI with pentapeptide repeats
MANDDHIAQLNKGVDAWNAWREEYSKIRADLRQANLSGANLSEADLTRANLRRASLVEAKLSRANLSGASLVGANLSEANLSEAKLSGADLSKAILRGANLSEADLPRANLREADLFRAKLRGVNLTQANLTSASLKMADLTGAKLFRASLLDVDLDYATLVGTNLKSAELSHANLAKANLSGADLRDARLLMANLTWANFTDADLTGCRIWGVSAWNLELEGAKQQNLVITPRNEPKITVDKVEVAQFVYLMLHNKKIRDVIETVTSKAVLILGCFTDKRKAVLDALREELRKRDYLPILFDFNVPATRDITETVSLLARMARFIIADLTDPSSIPKELEAIVPSLAVPVQPLLEGSSRPYAMFSDYWKYDWVLPVYRYQGLELLLATLVEKVIAPAEEKVKGLAERRRMIEAELTKPR